MKKLLKVIEQKERHWVGDGFPVRTLFSYNDLASQISPFLLMDYAGPVDFPPNPGKGRRGVGEHPHRGFETVTIVFSGEVEHRDSAGGGGRIGPGEVQWMTAASGLVHEEMHGENFSKTGGRFEMVQLWVDLPAKDKMTKPRYQGLSQDKIPKIDLPNQAGTLAVIAGEWQGHRGPAKTFSPIQLWNVILNSTHTADFQVPAGHTCLVFVLSGALQLRSGEKITEAQMAMLSPEGSEFDLQAAESSRFLILAGQPLNQPVVGYGPFVMTNQAEIRQAFLDFQSGQMGHLGQIEGSER